MAVSLFPNFDAGLAELVRVTRPGGCVVIAAFGPVQQAEFITFFMSALQATVPGFVSLSAEKPPLPFQVSAPETLRKKLVRAGLTSVQVETTMWDMRFRSARHYWDAATFSNPIAVQLTADLAAEQRDDAVQVLDGMLRERSGGDPAAVLRNEATVGVGSKRARG